MEDKIDDAAAKSGSAVRTKRSIPPGMIEDGRMVAPGLAIG